MQCISSLAARRLKGSRPTRPTVAPRKIMIQRTIMHPVTARTRITSGIRKTRTHDDRDYRLLTMVDEFTRQRLAMRVAPAAQLVRR